MIKTAKIKSNLNDGFGVDGSSIVHSFTEMTSHPTHNLELKTQKLNMPTLGIKRKRS